MVEPLFRHAEAGAAATGSRIELSGPEAKHALAVRRMRVGEAIQLTDGLGARVRGVVASIAERSLQIEVHAVEHEPMPATRLTLIQALAKGDRDELAIQAATELGAFEITPWQAERSISRWDSAKAVKGVERWQTIVSEAAKQSLRVWEPVVTAPMTTAKLCASVADFAQLLILDPTASAPLASVETKTGRVGIVVGPEGGISGDELDAFERAGAVRVRLGSEILRTSTAGIAAISVLQAKLGSWS